MAEHTEHWVLNHLIETCRDGERGFHFAASHVQDTSLQDLFKKMASQRAQFAAELAPHAERLGGGTAADGSTAGALHRGWMTVMNVMPGNHDRAIVVEAERGEEAAMNAYKTALDGMLPPTTRDLIERQYTDIREAHDRVKSRLNPARVP